MSSRHSFCLLLVSTNTLHFKKNNCEKDMFGVCLWVVISYSIRETLAMTKSAFFPVVLQYQNLILVRPGALRQNNVIYLKNACTHD